MLRHLPNALTILRLAATPVILWRIALADYRSALVLFFLSGLTDTIDGTLARRFNWTSRLGAILDPIADKLLLVSVFLALGIRGDLPVWLVATVLLRDAIILVVALWLRGDGRVKDFPPSVFGKLSTLLQLLTAGSVLLGWPDNRMPFYVGTALLAFLSASHYGYQIRQKLN